MRRHWIYLAVIASLAITNLTGADWKPLFNGKNNQPTTYILLIAAIFAGVLSPSE